MTTIIRIKSVESAMTSTDKPYWKVDTDQGKMSLWEDDIAGQLEECRQKNQSAEVEIKTKGAYKNIVKFVKAIDTPNVAPAYATDKYEGARDDKTWSMRESYAKDLFGMLITQNPIVTMDPKEREQQTLELAELAVKVENALRIGTNKIEVKDEKKV